jgi:hypothetical protein
VFSADDQPAAVVQGFFPDLSWKVLAEGAIAIRNGALWLATNLDATVPSPRGPLPGNGSMVAALRHATGIVPVATGKPDPAMHAESVLRSRAEHPIVVGDRLDTDIEGARRADCASLLVLTGVTDAGPLHRPDYLGADVSALLERHPDVLVEPRRARCGAAAVQIERRTLVLSLEPGGLDGAVQSSDGLDPLRALVVAGWQLIDQEQQPDGVRGADPAAEAVLAGLGLG